MSEEVKRTFLSPTHAFIEGGFQKPEVSNYMLTLGFKYFVLGDGVVTKSINPFTGIQIVDYNTHYFKDKIEADKYASTQRHPLFPEDPVCVETLEYQQTSEDLAREREKQKEKKVARMKAEAESLGMDDEQYDDFRRARNRYKAHLREIRSCQSIIAEKEESIRVMEDKNLIILEKYGHLLQ